MLGKFVGKKNNNSNSGDGGGGGSGGSDPWEPSGQIIKELVLPREAADDGDLYELIQSNITVVNYLLYTCHYLPSEIVPEAMWSYQVDYYQSQAVIGHGRYVASSLILNGKMQNTIEGTRRGLEAMGAHDFTAIYEELLALLASDQALAEATEAGNGYDVPPPIWDLDMRFSKLDSDWLRKQNHSFLLGLPCLRLVPKATWAAEMEKMPFLNPKLKGREAVVAREREQARARQG